MDKVMIDRGTLEVISFICDQQPFPRVGDWNWPRIKEKCDAALALPPPELCAPDPTGDLRRAREIADNWRSYAAIQNARKKKCDVNDFVYFAEAFDEIIQALDRVLAGREPEPKVGKPTLPPFGTKVGPGIADHARKLATAQPATGVGEIAPPPVTLDEALDFIGRIYERRNKRTYVATHVLMALDAKKILTRAGRIAAPDAEKGE